MSVHAVLLGGSGVSEGLRDVLVDYSAAGLLEDFVWVPLAGVGPDTRCLIVSAGAVTTARLVDVVADGLGAGARFAAISALVTGSRSPGTAEVNSVERMLPLGPGDRYRVLLTGSEGIEGEAREAVVGGWHNVLLAPEDSDAPGSGQVLLGADPSPAELGRVLAPRLAALLGLWVGQDRAPLDDEQPSPGPQVRFFRSFTRFLDGAELEQQLKAAVLPAPGRLHLPMIGGQPAQDVPNARAAASEMGERIWARHRRVLDGERAPRSAPRPEPRSWRLAVRLFASFVLASLRNAPGAWLQKAKSAMASAAAATVHDVVYGVGSAYTVVIAGRLPDGRPAQWHEVADAVGELSTALTTSGHLSPQPSPSPLGELWKDFVNGALTLGDAGRRDAALPPVTVGGTVGIIADPSAIVPDPNDVFPLSSGPVEARLGVSSIPAADVLAANRLRTELQRLETTDVTTDAARVRERLESWYPKRSSAFSTAFANPLAKRLSAVTEEIGQLLAVLERLSGSTAVGVDEVRHQRGLGRRVLLTGLIGLLATVAGYYVVDQVAESGWRAWLAVALLLIATVVAMLWVFTHGQAALFRALNAMETAQSELELTRANLGFAISHHRQLVSAYRQFQSWSAILGEVLARPFGTPVAADDSRDPGLESLPRSVRRAAAATSPSALGYVSVDLRRRHLQQGWLSRPLEAIQEDGVRQLGPDAQHLRGVSEAMFTASGLAFLPAWTGVVLERGVGDAPADLVWGEVLEDLRSRPAGANDALVESVRDHGREESVAGFLGALTAPQNARPFPHSVLAPGARVGTASEPQPAVVTRATTGLSSWLNVSELSEGFNSWDLQQVGATTTAPSPQGAAASEAHPSSSAVPPSPTVKTPEVDIDEWTY